MTSAALPVYETQVAAEWIDYNGHMSEAFYVLVFGYATDQAMEHLGMGPAYREASGCSLYTVEAHVRYLREVGLGAPLTVRTRVVGEGPKKLHLAHEMHSGAELVATEEILGLHVDQAAGGTVGFPEDVSAAIRVHAEEPPGWCGRRVG
ncbi:thioesterase family protein [Nesterenkonia sp. PF2B19]|uniref:thioesterase family protein n=1 Tax=Nesterenkonia sp. PF2B19 TaxID=1881858 RepID=UPI0008726C57|nr:thioesterase family protein [Nesterenkonia sp. PF2B19]OSM43833.1 4-hydroxybenzoyl-CoA thioesterase [Nesterenkonia sp. PF2B19]